MKGIAKGIELNLANRYITEPGNISDRPDYVILNWPLILDCAVSYGEDKNSTFDRASTSWYIPKGSSTWTQAAIGVARFEDNGYLCEPQRTNIALYSQNFTHTAWVKTTTTIDSDTMIAPDGAITMDTLTATGANSTVLQTVVSASADRVFSLFLKRKTGTGNIDLTVDNGVTWHNVAVTSETTRFTITQAAVTNPVFGIRIVASGDAVYCWQSDLETGIARTTIIPTTTSPVTRAADDLRLPVADGINFSQSEGMLFCEWAPGHSGGHPSANAGIFSLRDATASLLQWNDEDGRLNSWDGTTAPFHDAGGFVSGTAYKVYVRWASGTNFQVGYSGSSGTAASYDGAFVLGTHIRIGYGATESFHIKNILVLDKDKGQAYAEEQTS